MCFFSKKTSFVNHCSDTSWNLKKNIICKLIEVLDVNNVLIVVGEKPIHIFQDKEIISNTNGAPPLHSLTSFFKKEVRCVFCLFLLSFFLMCQFFCIACHVLIHIRYAHIKSIGNIGCDIWLSVIFWDVGVCLSENLTFSRLEVLYNTLPFMLLQGSEVKLSAVPFSCCSTSF